MSKNMSKKKRKKQVNASGSSVQEISPAITAKISHNSSRSKSGTAAQLSYLKRHWWAVAAICFLALGTLGSGLKYLEEDARRQIERSQTSATGQREETWLNLINPFLTKTPPPLYQLSKEYIYAGDKLLAVEDANAATATPSPPPCQITNVALSANGGTASASSESSSSYAASLANNGTRAWGNGGGWRDGTPDSFPDWLQVDFNGSKTINEIDVFAVRDDYSSPADPTEAETFSLYGITNFDVQYWNGSAWATVPNGNVTNNNKVWKKIAFSAITTSKIRVVVNNALASYSRIVELEAWTDCSNATPTPTPTVTPTPTPTPTATPTPCQITNVALSSNGGVVSASSNLAGGEPAKAIDGIRNWATSGTWKDATPDSFPPDWLQVDFNGSKTINEIHVYGVRNDYTNTADPTEATISSLYGITSFEVQYWNGSAWATVPNGNVTNNNKVWKKIAFPAITTSKIRVAVNDAHDGYSRIVELEAWTDCSSTTPTPTPTPTATPTPTPTPTPTVTPTPTPTVRKNFALAANGGTASASSVSSSTYAASFANDGVRNWGTSGGWRDGTPDSFPDWLQVDFSDSKTIDEINVFTIKDEHTSQVDPTETETFTLYGITGFDVQYWNGSAWTTVPTGTITSNNKVWRKFVFSPITTNKIRVVVNNGLASYSRIVELEAWGDEMQGFFRLNPNAWVSWLYDWSKCRGAESFSICLKQEQRQE